MKYVIDSSIEVKTIVPEKDSDKAIRLRDDYRNGVHELHAPEFFTTEVCNTLMILERSGRIKPGEARLFLVKFLRELPILHENTPLLPRALDIAQQHRQSVYDCLYIALAELESCEFATADDRLVRAVQPTFPFVIALDQFPA